MAIVSSLIAISVLADGAWGPDLLKFNLENTEKIQAMIWVSGFSYSSTELLKSGGCLDDGGSIGSKELIQALNEKYSGKTITAEQATEVAGDYIRATYPCAAYNK
jgi:hypothetical protein